VQVKGLKMGPMKFVLTALLGDVPGLAPPPHDMIGE
jgi:hypothetical protein